MSMEIWTVDRGGILEYHMIDVQGSHHAQKPNAKRSLRFELSDESSKVKTRLNDMVS